MKRGEIWLIDFDPVRGHEQAGKRPALILSADAYNSSGGTLLTVLPVTSKQRLMPSRIRITPPEGGLSVESWVICEQPRTVSKQRLGRRWGTVTPTTMRAVSDAVRLLLDL